jgi:sugar (pentulose or hexulose) kinase
MTQSLPRRIAVIDIGKTNAKVVLIDAESEAQLGARSRPNAVLRDAPYPHADVEGLWDFILTSLGDLNREHGIEGISITTHGATAALMAGGELALPVLDYEYDGPEASDEAYGRARPGFSETLSPRLPNGLNLGAQIFWQSRAFPEDFARVTAILAYPQYWAWRLTGVLASEVTSLGCHTDLWAPESEDFSTMVDAQGWRELFPPIKPAAAVLGPILPNLAAETGLSEGTPVTCGIHDSNASLVPHLGRDETPFTILSTGTWTICMTVGGDTAGLDQNRDSLANVDAFGRPVPTARFMGGREFDTMVKTIVEPTEEDIAAVIEAQVFALPTFAPGVGPFGGKTGRWSVEPGDLPPGQRTAVASLYLALVARECLELCGLGRSITIEGPLARNGLFGAALAQLADRPVHASGDGTGTSLGASLLFGGQPAHETHDAPIAPLTHPGFAEYAERWQERARK